MPVSYVQSIESIDTWFHVTNNLVSQINNSNAVLLANKTTTGNVNVNGVITVATLNVNASSNLAGSFANISANLFHTGTNAVFTSNVVISSSVLTVSANASLTGIFANVTGYLRVAGNVAFSNTLSVTGATTLSNTLGVTGATTLSGAASLLGAVTANSTVTINGATTANAVTVLGALTTNGTVTLAGPLQWESTFVITPTTLSGAGVQNDLANTTSGISNTNIYRVASDQAKNISGLHVSDPTQYREIRLMNVGNFDITLLHANTSSVANNQFLCPANTDFTLMRQGIALLVYDANASIRKWRVIGGSSFALNANNANYLGGKAEGSLNVNSASTATSALNANVATYASYFYVANTGSVPLIHQYSDTGINASALSTGTVPVARLVSANSSASGIVNTSSQIFAGAKQFPNGLVLPVGTNMWVTA